MASPQPPPAETTPTLIESPAPIEEPMKSPPTENEEQLIRQYQIEATYKRLNQLGQYLSLRYQATGNPFVHCTESELQQWRDLAEMMRDATKCIDDFVPKRPTLTLIQGGAA